MLHDALVVGGQFLRGLEYGRGVAPAMGVPACKFEVLWVVALELVADVEKRVQCLAVGGIVTAVLRLNEPCHVVAEHHVTQFVVFVVGQCPLRTHSVHDTRVHLLTQVSHNLPCLSWPIVAYC